MLKKGFHVRLVFAGLSTVFLALSAFKFAQAQEPAEAGIRLEWRTETEPEYHHKYTNCVLVQGGRKLVFQPPAGWVVRLQQEERKVIFYPANSGQWLSLQLVATNALMSKPSAVAIAPASTNAPAITNAPPPDNVSFVKPETLQEWFKASLPTAQITDLRPVSANGLPGVAAALQYTENGRLRTCQTACVDLCTNFLVVAHALPGTNQNSMYVNGVLTSLTLETNSPAR